MTNQGNCSEDVVVLGVTLDCVVAKFLCGERISYGPAETVMVGEC